MYVLQNNVEIIAGTKNYCIYDLNTLKMYAIDSKYKEYIEMCDCCEKKPDKIPEDVFSYLINAGLIVSEQDVVKIIKSFEYNKKINFAWIEVTQNCNLACKHCYEESSKYKHHSDMTLEDFKLAVHFLLEMGIKRIQLVGGEPLKHPLISELIQYVSGKFEFIEIYTNGTLLSDYLLSQIKKEKVHLAFSVYSDNPKIHDSVTDTKGSWELTDRAINSASAMGIECRVASVEMNNVPKFCIKNQNVEYRSDLPKLSGRASIELYNKDMLERKLITKNTFKSPINVIAYMKNKKIHNCFGERLYVDCNLNIYPCVMERRIVVGNIKKDSVKCKSKIGGDYAFMNKDRIESCKNCEFRYACFDCRPDNNGEKLYGKPWYCTYLPDKGEWIDKDQFIDNLLNNNYNKKGLM